MVHLSGCCLFFRSLLRDDQDPTDKENCMFLLSHVIKSGLFPGDGHNLMDVVQREEGTDEVRSKCDAAHREEALSSFYCLIKNDFYLHLFHFYSRVCVLANI